MGAVRGLSVDNDLQRTKVVQRDYRAACVALDQFFRICAVAKRGIGNGGEGVILKAKCKRHVLGGCRDRLDRIYRRADQKTRQIDEMADFAKDSSAAFKAVVDPAIGGAGPGVYPHQNETGPGGCGEMLACLYRQRCKTAVEADLKKCI